MPSIAILFKLVGGGFGSCLCFGLAGGMRGNGKCQKRGRESFPVAVRLEFLCILTCKASSCFYLFSLYNIV